MRQNILCLSGLGLILGLASFQGCTTDTDGPGITPVIIPEDTAGNSEKPSTATPKPDSGKSTVPPVTIVEINGAETWQSLFIKSSSEIPWNEFKAFYFEDSTASITAYSERVLFPALSFATASPQGIPAKRFNAYWIGKFAFPESVTWHIDLSQSNSFARILIDKREIYSGRINRNLSQAFAKGDHVIEIEYKNDGDAASFQVLFARDSVETPPVKVDTAAPGVEYWYAAAYESGNANSSLEVVLKKSNKPVVLFLSSYDALQWNIRPADSSQVLAVYVDSFEPQSTVTGLRASVPVTTRKGIPFSYKLLPDCHPEVGYCDDPGFSKLVSYIKSEFKTSLTGYTGAYDPDSLTLPAVILDSAKYKEIESQTQALIESSRLRLLVDVFAGDTAATWQSHFVTSATEIPLGKFQAFYFSDKDPKTVLYSEVATAPAIKYSFSEFHQLSANDFAGYWIGQFEFATPTVLDFGIDQSHAQTAIYVDKRPILAGPESTAGTVSLSAGKHLIEIQHINNWHTIDYSVSLNQK